MRIGVWSRGARLGTAAVLAGLLIALAGCGGAGDAEAEAAAPPEAAEEPSFVLAEGLVDERPLMADAWSGEEAQDFPEFEERIATIDEGLGIWSDGMEQMLTTREFSMKPYEDLSSMFSDPTTMGDLLEEDQDYLTHVIPALGEGGSLPAGVGGDASRNGEQLPDLKVVGEPRIRYANTTTVGVEDDFEDLEGDLLHGSLNAIIQVDLEDETTATFAYYMSFGSAAHDPADELWAWRSNVQLFGVG